MGTTLKGRISSYEINSVLRDLTLIEKRDINKKNATVVPRESKPIQRYSLKDIQCSR